MYKSIVETDFVLALTIAFTTVLIVAGVIARAVRWVATAHNAKSNARPPSTDSELAPTARRNVSDGMAPCCLDPL
jgi:hypothetical protein